MKVQKEIMRFKKQSLGLWVCCFLFLTTLPSVSLSQQSTNRHVEVSIRQLPSLPPISDHQSQPGLGGAFAGTHNDVLIVAGGANFPESRPWEGGEKVWWDNIYVLDKSMTDEPQWVVANTKLPKPLAYGVSISLKEGLLCIGGDDGVQKSNKVFLVKWDKNNRKIDIEEFPSLPIPLAYMAGARVGNEVFVAGGMSADSSTSSFFSLNLLNRNSKWKSLESWPGPPRIMNMACAQSDGEFDALFMLGGRNVQLGKRTQLLGDGYKWVPKLQKWTAVKTLYNGNIMAGSIIPKGAHYFLVIGGTDGKSFLQQELLNEQLSDSLLADSVKSILQAKKVSLQKGHPGFSKEIRLFNAVTEEWSLLDTAEVQLPVTTPAVSWNGTTIIPTGEISPGVRTTDVLQLDVVSRKSHFGYLNYAVIIFYLIAMVVIGFYFSNRQKSTDDYFKGGGRIPWWAAGVSIFGTLLSAITFMAIPARTFTTDWSYFMLNMSIILVTPLVTWLFIPFYAKLKITSAYEYLEMRFNLATRLMGSISFILFQLGRIAIVLFLPSIAISIFTGIDILTCILVMGLLSIIYTTIGGIEAVIWTDFVQVVVLLGGALLSFFLIISALDEGFSTFISVGVENSKFTTFRFDWDLVTSSFWVVLIGGLASNLTTQGTDQSIVQRYLTSTDLADSKKTLYTNAVLTLPASVIFFSLGTALYVFYKANPTEATPLLESNDGIFPWYIVSQLPAGISGLLIAALLAASMSSLSSSLNSGATAFVKDFYQRFNRSVSDTNLLKTAKYATIIIGIIGTTLAVWMATSQVTSLWDEFLKYLGLFIGGLGGVFLLGMMTRRANGTGAILGLLSSSLVQYYISNYTELNILLYALTGMLSCTVIGYLSSFFFKSTKDMTGLTIKHRE